jgi:hypothetical protein
MVRGWPRSPASSVNRSRSRQWNAKISLWLRTMVAGAGASSYWMRTTYAKCREGLYRVSTPLMRTDAARVRCADAAMLLLLFGENRKTEAR